MALWICSPGGRKGSEMAPKMDPNMDPKGAPEGSPHIAKTLCFNVVLLQTDPTKGRGKVPKRSPKGTQNVTPNDTVPFWFEPKEIRIMCEPCLGDRVPPGESAGRGGAVARWRGGRGGS